MTGLLRLAGLPVAALVMVAGVLGVQLARGGGGYGLVRCGPRAGTHLRAEATGRPLEPGTPVPGEWVEEVRGRGLTTTAPETMSDLPDARALAEVAPWQPGGETPLDRAVAATRRAVYPLHGLDPDDPRD